MDHRTEFDFALEQVQRNRRSPEGMADAAIHVHDTMKLAIDAARSLFGDAFTPALALDVYDRIEAARQSQRTDSRS
ncbi:hypothetical protein [Sediminicurvatus halobius]|uniref:hypothetical protein n=1 Tax=Sediminicurvatus halobius TaxID=2182432 RepID=UPI001E3AD8CE|nr:hypothetical protein [Spiribacter halobius]